LPARRWLPTCAGRRRRREAAEWRWPADPGRPPRRNQMRSVGAPLVVGGALPQRRNSSPSPGPALCTVPLLIDEFPGTTPTINEAVWSSSMVKAASPSTEIGKSTLRTSIGPKPPLAAVLYGLPNRKLPPLAVARSCTDHGQPDALGPASRP